MEAISPTIYYAMGVIVAITALLCVIKSLVAYSRHRRVKDYDRFVHDYYGQYGKSAPILIARYHNKYIEDYNRCCEGFISRLLMLRKIPLIDDPSYKPPVNLFPETQQQLPPDIIVAQCQSMLNEEYPADKVTRRAIKPQYTSMTRRRHTGSRQTIYKI